MSKSQVSNRVARAKHRGVRAIVAALYVAGIAGSPFTARAVDEPPEGDEAYTPFPCPANWSGISTPYQGHIWLNTWRKQAATNVPHVAWYQGVENPFKDVTGKWEWISPGGLVTCQKYSFFGFELEDYRMTLHSGNVVPYGPTDEEESEVTTNPGSLGGEDDPQTDEWYVCWYYRYADGSRSAYYRCDPL